MSAWAISELRAVAEGRRRLQAIHHPLGFTCLPLVRLAGGDGVCVHLWSPAVRGMQPTTSMIHSHSWRLTSYVLYGQLRNVRVRVTDVTGDADDGERVFRVFRVRSHGDVDELRPTDRLVECEPELGQENKAGDVYSLPAGIFHITEVPSQAEAVTVALGNVVEGAADLSLGGVFAVAHEARRTRCNARETVSLAGMIGDRLLAPLVRA